MVICIEGTIGAGKTSLINTPDARNPDKYAYYPEPIEQWERPGGPGGNTVTVADSIVLPHGHIWNRAFFRSVVPKLTRRFPISSFFPLKLQRSKKFIWNAFQILFL